MLFSRSKIEQVLLLFRKCEHSYRPRMSTFGNRALQRMLSRVNTVVVAEEKCSADQSVVTCMYVCMYVCFCFPLYRFFPPGVRACASSFPGGAEPSPSRIPYIPSSSFSSSFSTPPLALLPVLLPVFFKISLTTPPPPSPRCFSPVSRHYHTPAPFVSPVRRHTLSDSVALLGGTKTTVGSNVIAAPPLPVVSRYYSSQWSFLSRREDSGALRKCLRYILVPPPRQKQIIVTYNHSVSFFRKEASSYRA